MKCCNPISRKAQGYALLLVMVFTTLGAFVLAATMTRTANVTKLNERERQYTMNLSAAEAATEKILARVISDFRKDGSGGVAAALNSYRYSVPTAADSPFWTNFAFSDGQGNANRTYIGIVSNWNYVPMESQYYGLFGYAAKYRVLSNVKNLSGPEKVTVGAQQDVQPAQIPIFQFAVFYNGLLEFTWAFQLAWAGGCATGSRTRSRHVCNFNSAS